MIRLRTGLLRNLTLHSLKKQDIFLSETSKPVPKSHPASYSITTSFPFLNVNQPWRGADHSQHSVDFKNAWRRTSNPAYTFMHRHEFTSNITTSLLLHLHLLNVSSLFLCSILFSVFFLFSISFVFPTQMCDTGRADRTVYGPLLTFWRRIFFFPNFSTLYI